VTRFYPILDTGLLERRGMAPVDAAAAILDGGARLLQLRHKGHWTCERFGQAEQIARMCAGAGALLMVNDRADIAMLLGAGLHVGQQDLAPADARRLIGPGRMLGFSTHNESQFLAATMEPADYLALGPIFATNSKADPDPMVGLEGLRRARRLSSRPMVAIGGITRQRAAAVFAAGADCIAVIGDLYPDPLDSNSLRERVRAWIETGGGVSDL
jgi:thiamine-phosphate pyrophosphorylase